MTLKIMEEQVLLMGPKNVSFSNSAKIILMAAVNANAADNSLHRKQGY
jgi:hypothetical protein